MSEQRQLTSMVVLLALGMSLFVGLAITVMGGGKFSFSNNNSEPALAASMAPAKAATNSPSLEVTEITPSAMVKVTIADGSVIATSSQTAVQVIPLTTKSAQPSATKSPTLQPSSTPSSTSFQTVPQGTPTALRTNTALPSPFLTSTAIPSSTPRPTSTRIPTETPRPTSTRIPTETPRPTLTAIPTELPTSTAIPTELPTSTAIPTELPTSTAIPTELPSETPIATETASSTPSYQQDVPSTATNMPTLTALPPSATPSELPTALPTAIVASYPVPILLEPADQSQFAYPFTLRWSWDGVLGADEYFDVRLWRETGSPAGVTWTKEPQVTLTNYLGSRQTGRFLWTIVVIRGENGQWLHDLSPSPAPRSLTINTGGGGGGEQAEPGAPPKPGTTPTRSGPGSTPTRAPQS